MSERGNKLIRGAERPETLLFFRRFHSSERDARALGVTTLRAVMCAENGKVARVSGSISALVVGLVVLLNSAISVAVRGRRMERTLLMLAVSVFPQKFAV